MADWLREQIRLRRLLARILAAGIGVAAGSLVWRAVAWAFQQVATPEATCHGLCLFAALLCGWVAWVIADVVLDS